MTHPTPAPLLEQPGPRTRVIAASRCGNGGKFWIRVVAGGEQRSFFVTSAELLSPTRFAARFLARTGHILDTSDFEDRKGRVAWRQLVADALAANGGDA